MKVPFRKKNNPEHFKRFSIFLQKRILFEIIIFCKLIFKKGFSCFLANKICLIVHSSISSLVCAAVVHHHSRWTLHSETLVLLLKFSMLLLLKKSLSSSLWDLTYGSCCRDLQLDSSFGYFFSASCGRFLQMTQADRNSRNQKQHLS